MNTHKHSTQSWMKCLLSSKWNWLLIVIIILVVKGYTVSKISSAIDSLEYGLTPPVLPEHKSYEEKYLNPIGGNNESSQWFHHASQGTATIPIPYQWFVALEAPRKSPWLIFWGSEGLFVDEYILQLGFIQKNPTHLNPDGLPIGLAKTESIYFAGVDRKASAVGFTCAACHTGQLVHEDKRYIIDGGPSMIDLGQLTRSLGAALGQTALSSKFSFINGRFDRFAKQVLGSNDNPLTRSNLKSSLAKAIAELVKTSDTINVTEGFTRLDALNRIGNQVFSGDTGKSDNYAPIDAPVNYPHIWTTSWFDWVQYDGSIMQPLIRNTGEALGVSAYLDSEGPEQQRYASSVDITNLVKIEDWIGGTHPRADKKFNGVLAPKWPSDFPPISKQQAKQGKVLYQELCEGCHLPTIDNPEFWSDKHWKPIKYTKDEQEIATEETYLTLNIIPISEIGTDPAQANILSTRTIDTTGLDLNVELCTLAATDSDPDKKSLRYVPMSDSATANFGLALGALVDKTNTQWFEQNYIPESRRKKDEGLRPNCLQADMGYKARPLNGVWATGPFLHNGSVATVYDLLSPMSERPAFIELGGQTFDTKHLGVEQGAEIKEWNAAKDYPSYKLTEDYSDGLFILDTRQPGNYNTGHVFDDTQAEGVIGRHLQEAERLALIEYLKTL